MRLNPARGIALSVAAASLCAHAQSSRVAGYVPTVEAHATGALMVSGDKTVLGGASTVTALDRTAHVRLDRGGEVLVCSTSVVHLTSSPRAGSQNGNPDGPLLLSLDRGALEIRMRMSGDDAVMTPDLRFTSPDLKPGKSEPLDLTMRVTPNGDTCVDNRGRKLALEVHDAFGEGAYRIKPGQRVLFEHGSLKEVVDRESGPCGCPDLAGVSLAEAAVRGGGKGAEGNPFPAAQSEGLAPPSPPPAQPSGQTHVEVASSLSYDPSTEAPAAATASPAAAPAQPTLAAQQPVPAKPAILHSIGGFFKHIFVR